jgi:hypothetical protein
MPAELSKAHLTLNKLVLAAYGLPKEASDAQILEKLFTLYSEFNSLNLLL